jgi:hypothetical protein
MWVMCDVVCCGGVVVWCDVMVRLRGACGAASLQINVKISHQHNLIADTVMINTNIFEKLDVQAEAFKIVCVYLCLFICVCLFVCVYLCVFICVCLLVCVY